ncbi:MAG: chorismate mutase [Ilumatobacteraceae bacterium]
MSDQSSPEPPAELAQLRTRIDELDRQLLDILSQRLAVCHEVAHIKEERNLPIIQPQRVRDVVTRRRQEAIDLGMDPDFAEQVMRAVLAETHRIEVAGRRPDAAPTKSANPETLRTAVDAAIDTVATRIDHVVVAVEDLDAALNAFTTRFGFHRSPSLIADGRPEPGIAVVSAGGVILVLVSPLAGPDVAAHIAAHGSGIHHVAIEVLNADYARSALLGSSPDAGDASSSLTDVVVDDHGHEQFFTVRDPDSGVQLGFIARTGHRVGVATANVLQAFRH